MEGTIRIDGPIGLYPEEGGVFLADVIAQVKKQPDATSYKVYINSEGGRVDIGFDIYNYLKSLGVPITTIGNGIVASIATVIFMAGSTRLVRQGTRFMIHLPIAGIQGTADEMEAHSKRIKKIEKKIIKFYMENFELGREAIEPLLKTETWLNETQLKDLQIITDEPIEVAAMASLKDTEKKYRKPKKSKLMNKKQKTLLHELASLLRGEEIINKVVLDAEMNEVVFPEVGEDEPLEVGDAATVDGQPATGEILLQDGRTLVFGDNGVLTEIREAGDSGDDTQEDELASVRKELQEANQQIATLKKTNDQLTKEVETTKAKLTKVGAVMKRIQEVESLDGGTEARDSGKNGAGKPKPMSDFELAMRGVKDPRRKAIAN